MRIIAPLENHDADAIDDGAVVMRHPARAGVNTPARAGWRITTQRARALE